MGARVHSRLADCVCVVCFARNGDSIGLLRCQALSAGVTQNVTQYLAFILAFIQNQFVSFGVNACGLFVRIKYKYEND